MSAHMVLVRNESPAERLALMVETIDRVKKKLSADVGFFGVSAWHSIEDPDEVMILVEFCGDDVERTQSKLAIEATKRSSSPAEVTVFDLEAFGGVRPGEAPGGTFLSVSRRIASPGHGVELEQELDTIFGSLSVIPGYLGYVYGSHVTVPDQVLGLVLWDSEESFRLSLPKNAPYRLHLYQKVL